MLDAHGMFLDVFALELFCFKNRTKFYRGKLRILSVKTRLNEKSVFGMSPSRLCFLTIDGLS